MKSFIAKVVIGNLVSKITSDLYFNRHKVKDMKLPKFKTKTLEDKIEKADFINIGGTLHQVTGFIFEEEEKLFFTYPLSGPDTSEQIFNLSEPDDVTTLEEATFYTLKEIK